MNFYECVDHSLEISFDLPFWLKTDGDSPFLFRKYAGFVRIQTIKRENPKIPGLDIAKNAYLVHDDTDHIAQTNIHLKLRHVDVGSTTDEAMIHFFSFHSELIDICNFFITTARFAFSDFVLRQVSDLSELSNLQWKIKLKGSDKLQPVYLSQSFLNGGITNVAPNYNQQQRNLFGHFIVNGVELSMSLQLLSDAKHYKLKKNHRMSLVNLVISFEVFLAELLQSSIKNEIISISEDELDHWSLKQISDKGIKAIFGGSFSNANVWGGDQVELFEKIRTVRNAILHSGRLRVVFANKEYNFYDTKHLNILIEEIENLKDIIINKFNNLPKK